jgi:hypothetical protein
LPITDLATVTKFTKDYLLYMLGEVEKILENDGDLVDAYNIDQSAYTDWGIEYHLANVMRQYALTQS